jgi:hypothetical protein
MNNKITASLPGKATHLAHGRGTKCGLVGKLLTTTDPNAVNCQRCRTGMRRAELAAKAKEASR